MTATMNLDEHFAGAQWMAPALASARTAGADAVTFDFGKRRVLLTCQGKRAEIHRYVTFEAARYANFDVIAYEVHEMRKKLEEAAA